MSRQSTPTENIEDITTPYYMFKYTIRSELTRRYYERRIRTFFDYIGFSKGSELEKRCNLFAEEAKKDSNWATIR
ncbi:MAG TPA: hypothetical protein VIP29_04340 [Nitrososphaeraceae archaeon]